jgi:hypothetical protein
MKNEKDDSDTCFISISRFFMYLFSPAIDPHDLQATRSQVIVQTRLSLIDSNVISKNVLAFFNLDISVLKLVYNRTLMIRKKAATASARIEDKIELSTNSTAPSYAVEKKKGLAAGFAIRKQKI